MKQLKILGGTVTGRNSSYGHAKVSKNGRMTSARRAAHPNISQFQSRLLFMEIYALIVVSTTAFGLTPDAKPFTCYMSDPPQQLQRPISLLDSFKWIQCIVSRRKT